MSYMVASAASYGALRNRVVKLQKEGWRPQGGVSVSIRPAKDGETRRSHVEVWAQALVLEGASA